MERARMFERPDQSGIISEYQEPVRCGEVIFSQGPLVFQKVRPTVLNMDKIITD